MLSVPSQTRTTPAVSAIARSVLSYSTRDGAGGDRRTARRRAAVDLARRRVARAGVAVAGLRQPERAGGDGLRPQRIHPGAVSGVAPRGADFFRHDTAQVVLDVEVVHDAVRAEHVVQLDSTAVVRDRSAARAHAEHRSGRRTGPVDGRRERDRTGHTVGQQLPVEGLRFGIDQRLGGLRLLDAPQPVDGQRLLGLEVPDCGEADRAEDPVDGSGVGAEVVEQSLHLLDRLTL